MLNWQIFGMISVSAFCGVLFAVLLGREALSVLNRITVWIRARPFRALILLPLVGLLVAYAGTKPGPGPSAEPELYANTLAKPFAGDATYVGWKRTAEGRIEGLLTIKAAKAAKPEKGGQSKLTFTEKTGVVKGSFSIPGPTGKAQKYTVNGVVVGGTFHGAAFAKGLPPVACTADEF